jgi:methyl-accepting chemotaxis protein
MARRITLTAQISAFISVFIALLVGSIIILTGIEVSKTIKGLTLASNEQIAVARSYELGEMMDKLKWQLKGITTRQDMIEGEREAVGAFLQAQKNVISPEVVGMLYIWKNGDYISSENATGNISDREYYKAVLVDGKREAVSKAVISKSLNAPIVVTVVGIAGEDGKNRAAVAFQFKLDKLSQIVSGIRVGKNSFGWIVDSEGMVIAHPDASFIMNKNLLDMDKDGFKGMDALGKRIVNEESGVGGYTDSKGTVMTNFFVSVPNTPGWKLGISVPEAEINAASRRIATMLSIIALVSLAIALGISVVIARRITRPINVICSAMGDFAKGDFSMANVAAEERERITARNDELGDLGRSLDEMVVSLKAVVLNVIESARQVSSGSEQLSTTSQQISQGATEQAAAVEEISASMEEMSSNIKQNAENAQKTESIARKSALSAEAGGTAVMQTVDAMKQIAEKITIIEEIARSTNMLSLNASIEAARAGEYGKGFAVVASEVGKLAERSSREASEISTLSVSSVKIAEEAGITIRDLIPEIKQTADLVQEISAASGEQDTGANQINQSISQLDQVVQQNASASEESASMSEELAGQADSLKETIGFFKI